MSDFEKKHLLSKIDVLVQFTPLKRNILHFACFFRKNDFDLKILKRVIFRIEKNTTRQILNERFYSVSDFELKVFRHVRFWKKTFAFKN